MTEKKVQVEIDGVSYNLITDLTEDQIVEISRYVEGKIREIKAHKLPYDKELVLTSLNIADDLFSVGSKYNRLREESQEAVENYPNLKENYNKAMEENEDLLARLQEMNDKNTSLQTEVADLNKKIKANDQADATIEKLRAEVTRLQQEAARLKSENDSLKENI